MKAGHVLIETGYQNTTADGGASVAQYPQALIRVGLRIPNLEVSVAPPTFNAARAGDGTSDTSYGAKYELGYSPKMLYGVNAVVSVPTGTNGFSAGGTGYTANANVLYALSPIFSLATTLGYNDLSNGMQRYVSFIPSLVGSAALTPSTSAFIEAASFSHALGAKSTTRVQYLTGLQQSVADKIQLDVEAGYSVTAATGKYRYLGFGISYAF